MPDPSPSELRQVGKRTARSGFKLNSGRRYRVVVAAKRSFRLTLELDPHERAHHTARITLSADGGGYEQSRGVRDDCVEGDGHLQLCFDHLLPDKRYSLRVDPGDGQAYWIFRGHPYERLVSAAGTGA